ncbi:ADC synthase [Podospora conica]|nr:ADC synthase [Schizothecium conicum]
MPSPTPPPPIRILLLDAHDSFTNNIISLLTTTLPPPSPPVHVSVLPIDAPLSRPAFLAELRRHTAVVCGPGPGSPLVDADVGLMRLVWELDGEDLLPALGVCLGFQSLVVAFGGGVRRLRRGMHGMVRGVEHCGGGLFEGVGAGCGVVLYHSLGGDVGQDGVGEGSWRDGKWGRVGGLVPMGWVEEEREGGGKERILMAVRVEGKPFWGVQYHPESVCTEEEGGRVVGNWLREAVRWNEERGRVVVEDGMGVAGAPTRASLLSRVGGRGAEGEWWEEVGVGGVLHGVTVPVPRGVQVPEIVEAVEQDGGERIVLDSANAAAAEARGDVRGRYSIVGMGLEEAPRVEYHTGDDYATVRLKRVRGHQVDMAQRVSLAGYGDIWGFVASFHEARRIQSPDEESDLPFVGGFMGYVTYEQGLEGIGISLEHPRPHHRPDVCLVWVTKSLVVDHLLGVIHVQHLCPDPSEATQWVDNTATRLLAPQAFHKRDGPFPPLKTRRPSRGATIHPPLTKEYEAKVTLCQEYIAAGESYELCLTDQTTITRPLSDSPRTTTTNPRRRRRSSTAPPPPSSWSLFKTLRARQPAPFASYLRLGPATLVSASPERFLSYTAAGLCSMRPMKGTVRKSAAVATLAQAERILHVPKEEAENLMIVDLVRHDLHAVCGPGRVTVPRLLQVEEYQSVFQMVTVVEGRLPPPPAPDGGGRHTGLDVLAASLPPGSMTGAPKRRSCEILRLVEGEGRERSLYSGVVGYMCATGRGDWSVTIRSLFRWDDERGEEEGEEEREVWHIGAGGAVTILSTPEGERDEMFTKLAGPLRVFADS